VQPLHPLRQSAYAALRCPICRRELGATGRSLSCRNRHNFDFAKSGYVNLALEHGRKPAVGGDTRDQLRRRDVFLSSGAFDFIADAIFAQSWHEGLPSVPLIVDAGCGPGYHLDRVVGGLATRIGRPCRGLGLDLSKEAALIAARHHQALGFVVADVWSEWPMRASAADLVISIFAPKNFREMARTLRPGGQVAIAYPGPRHLIELREAFGLMPAAEGKTALYRDQVRGFCGDIAYERTLRTVDLAHSDALNLILMGPNARHLSEDSIPAWPGKTPVTFDVELLMGRVPRPPDLL
jgi:23S rRNA (guanine745-N1)-methyltransferase